MQCTLGIDYGTNSVRALVVRVTDGRELGSCVVKYPSGREGVLLDTKDHLLARQHPGDYLTGLAKSVRGALAQAGKTRGFSPGDVVGIGVDSTGSSPIPVDAGNRALAVLPKWRKNLHAQCWLWKDHTAWREAAEITRRAATLRAATPPPRPPPSRQTPPPTPPQPPTQIEPPHPRPQHPHPTPQTDVTIR